MKKSPTIAQGNPVENPYATLVDEIDEFAILLLDHHGNILNWNKSAERIKGYKPEEIIGKHFRNFYTQDDQDSKLPEKLIRKAAKLGKAQHEGLRVRKNGELFFGSIVIKALYDDHHKVKGFLKVTREHADVMAGKKQAGKKDVSLRKRKVQASGSEPFFDESEQYSLAIINELKKRSIDLLDSKLILEQMVDDRTRKLKEVNDAYQASNEELISANEELNAMNERLVEASQLIQKQADIIIQQEDEQLNRVLDSSSDVIWSIDLTESSKNYVSRSAEKITGLSLYEMRNDAGFWMNCMHPQDRHIREACLEELNEKENTECNYRILDVLGQTHWMNEKMRVIKDANNVAIRRGGVASNITSLKNAEAALARERNLLRALIDNIPDRIYVKDKNFKQIINNQGAEYLSVTDQFSDDLMESDEVVAPDDDMHVLITGKALINKEETIRSTSGELHTVLTTKVPLKDEHGNTTGVIGISRDITDRKQAERELQKTSHVISKVNEVARIGYWLHNPSTEEMVWNDQTLEIFGLQKDYSGSFANYQQLIHPDDREIVIRSLAESIAEQKSFDSEHRIVQPDSTLRWVHERIDFVKSQNGETFELIGVVQDITTQKTTEEVLRQFNNRHEIISKATNDAIWEWDLINDFEIWKHGVETIFGYTEGRVISNRIWKDKIHPDDYQRIVDEINEAFARKASNWTSQFRYLCSDGTYKHVLNRAYIIYQNSEPVTVIGAMQDITEVIQYRLGLEKMVEERTLELNAALKKEKDLVAIKNQFVSIASHEFRTPLSTISLATGFIKKYKKELSPAQINKKLQNIEKQVDTMTYLLDDVLTIGKADAGKLQVNLTTIKFDIIKKLAEQLLRTPGVKHKLNFSQHCFSKSFMSDEKFFCNIVTNLITNAIKFSPDAKEVTLTVTSDKKHVTIKVKDDGIGIPPDDLKHLYTSFYRGSNVSDIEGTGLGLSIVKKSIDLLKGTIEVKSRMGKGTEFKVTLPIHYG